MTGLSSSSFLPSRWQPRSRPVAQLAGVEGNTFNPVLMPSRSYHQTNPDSHDLTDAVVQEQRSIRREMEDQFELKAETSLSVQPSGIHCTRTGGAEAQDFGSLGGHGKSL